MSDPFIHDKLVTFEEDPQGLLIKSEQLITSEFLDSIADMRFDSINTPSGEMHCVAAIPTSVVDQWYREGFDIMREPIRDILARLNKQSLDKFIATNKRI